MLVTVSRRVAGLVFAGLVIGFGAFVWSESAQVAALGPPAPDSPAIWSVHTSHPLVALTFDDGPQPGSTNAILGILRRYGAHATFFVVGRQAEHYPGYVRQLAQAGDEVENHGMTHRLLSHLTGRQITAEIRSSADLIAELTGRFPTYFRPPYGSFNRTVASTADALHERLVLWTIDTRDWTLRSPAGIARTVFAQLRPGAIILLHDGGGPRRTTAQALGDILEGLRARGYTAVTLEQLMRDATPAASPSR